MALTLIKENGTGLADANSYASVADGDAYHEGHVAASAWTSATVPRCPDVERSGGASYLPDDAVPVCLRDAACELARQLLTEDRTGDAEGIGLQSLSIEGALRMVFDPLRPKPVVPEFVQAMLARVGAYQGRRSGSVTLIRV